MPRTAFFESTSGAQRPYVTVPSSSTPGVFYELYQDEFGTWVCNCPGYRYRHYCSHADTEANKYLIKKDPQCRLTSAGPSSPTEGGVHGSGTCAGLIALRMVTSGSGRQPQGKQWSSAVVWTTQSSWSAGFIRVTTMVPRCLLTACALSGRGPQQEARNGLPGQVCRVRADRTAQGC
jgi:hypothetical protein